MFFQFLAFKIFHSMYHMSPERFFSVTQSVKYHTARSLNDMNTKHGYELMVVGGSIVAKNTLKKVTKIIIATLVVALIAIVIVTGLLIKNTNTTPKVKEETLDENFINYIKAKKHTTEETLTTIGIELRHLDKINNESMDENVNITYLTSPSTTQIMKGRLNFVKLESESQLPHLTQTITLKNAKR